jgi:hypothetical protein
MSNYQTAYDRWYKANQAACDAETRLFHAIEICRRCGGIAPTAEQLAEARRLRQVASEYLDAAMKEIWRRPPEPGI